jgi:RIO-like serine/threonine protein kinase
MPNSSIYCQSTAHDAAYFKASILHRDISVGNILIDEDGDGFLIDWDLCIGISDDPSMLTLNFWRS